jgi:hypothetical protein
MEPYLDQCGDRLLLLETLKKTIQEDKEFIEKQLIIRKGVIIGCIFHVKTEPLIRILELVSSRANCFWSNWCSDLSELLIDELALTVSWKCQTDRSFIWSRLFGLKDGPIKIVFGDYPCRRISNQINIINENY